MKLERWGWYSIAVTMLLGGINLVVVVASGSLADGELEQREILSNPHTRVEKAKGIRVSEWLLGYKIDGVLLKEDLQGKGPSYVFRDAQVEKQLTGSTTLADCIMKIKHRAN